MERVIAILKKQYGDDCLCDKSDSGAIKFTVTIRVSKKSEGDDGGEPGFSATAVISCAPDYPESCASTQIVSNTGMPADAIAKMTERLAKVTEEKKGEENVLLLVRIVRRFLLDQRVHECPNCKADLVAGDSESWRSHCGHFYHRGCIVSLIENSARAQQENRPEGGDEQAQTAERRPVCPACGLYEFFLRNDKPVSRCIKPGGGGGRFRNRRNRNRPSAGDGETGGEGEGEGETGQGDQRRRRQRKPRNRRGGGGENDEAPGGEGEGEAEGDAAPGQRRQRKKKPSNRRRRQQQHSGGEGDVEGEGGDDPKLFNQRRQADMRFNEFEQLRNQVGGGKGGGRRGGRGGGGGGYPGDYPQPGYIDENGGFYAPDGYYYYDGPRGFYAALEAFGGGGGGGRGGSRGGGRRRNRPRRPRGEGGNGDAGGPAENQSDPVAAE
ncbi:hypothetical protein BOX15_Mlig034055g2 [Macrostomum lignano]|uniref:Uncharacterized protein n=2 Tax=Macrostomum lignano TaxID=282301 RepID=A0A267GKH2_9PLAT|nr:hypothetical protein BOX15_Mlig034055g2 [Macrostomum lignano]